MKKLVLFDLDGTLIDTLEDLSEAVNHALALRGLPPHTLDEYRGMVGHGVRSLVQQALEASSPVILSEAKNLPSDALVDSALADFRAYYEAHIDVHTRPYPGIPELLSELHARGVKLAVASNKFQEGTEYLIKRFFPDIEFVAILGNRPGWPLKPSPEIVQDVLSRAGVDPEDALLVGDSPTDMRTAANGGIDALAVSWGYRSAEELDPVLRELFPNQPPRLVQSVPALRIELLGFYVSEPLTTPPATFETPLQQAVYERFAACGIEFSRVNTDPGITMEDCAHISARIGVQIVKTIFLCNRQQTEFYLYVTSHDRPFVTREFCGALGIPRVSFATAEKLWELTGVHVGATTILSAVLPSCAGVHLVMDASIASSDWFACTDGTPTCFVKLRTQDLLDKYLNGRKVTLIS
ncbi:MAG: HAD-IA family hydrolase [Bacteroidales bacterium]|nr:HAD-IA family hydrolase [Bacteroidales bacterium]